MTVENQPSFKEWVNEQTERTLDLVYDVLEFGSVRGRMERSELEHNFRWRFEDAEKLEKFIQSLINMECFEQSGKSELHITPTGIAAMIDLEVVA